MSNLPKYVKIARGFLVGTQMRQETLKLLTLCIGGLTLAIFATIIIVALEHQQHQYCGEVIRGALRDYFGWLDTWKR